MRDLRLGKDSIKRCNIHSEKKYVLATISGQGNVSREKIQVRVGFP